MAEDFMKPLQPVGPLAEIVGTKPMPRTEITARVWVYVKRKDLQDKKNRRMLNTDAKLRKLCGGKAQVSMFDLGGYVSKYLVEEDRPNANSKKGSLQRGLERQLTAALLDAYTAAGENVGYWARRFLQSVKRDGGLSTARRMLSPRTEGQRKGLDALLEANRPDLTIEAIVLQPRFRVLFTDEELAVAKERLGDYGKKVQKLRKHRDRLFPDELESGLKYVEGARKQVRVNAYERDPRARSACIEHHGSSCAVCGFSFEARYGELGKGFIHVHHLRPLAATDGQYELDPIADLRPVCPNCHAMLHRAEEVLSIEALRKRLNKAVSQRKQ